MSAERVAAAVAFWGAALVASVSLSGCYTFCDGTELFAAVERGELAAVHELGELGDPLIPASKSHVKPVRDAYPLLAPHLEATDAFQRLIATEALRRIAERRGDLYRVFGAGLLEARLADADAGIRWRAAWGLGRLERSGPELRAAAADADPRVAERAVWAIGRARDEQGLSALLAALEREEAQVRDAAQRALRRTTGLDYERAEAWRQWAAERALGPADDETEPPDDEPEAPSDG